MKPGAPYSGPALGHQGQRHEFETGHGAQLPVDGQRHDGVNSVAKGLAVRLALKELGSPVDAEQHGTSQYPLEELVERRHLHVFEEPVLGRGR